MSLSGFTWGAFGVPAILAWIAYGLAVLLAPHLAADPAPLAWAAAAVGGWYVLAILALAVSSGAPFFPF